MPRDLSKPLAASKFDKTDPAPYATGKDRAIARRNLNAKLKKQVIYRVNI